MTSSHNPEQNQILRKLQLTELKILTEFDRLCRKHNLRYYIVGGTLIGAVRHGGFIPWDDDIDVSMPREDFKKLLKIAESEFTSGYFLQTRKTDKCSFYYAKLRKNGTCFREEKFEHMDFHKGIFMDIFPLDYIPENKLLQKLLFKGFGLMSGIISSKEKTDEYLFRDKSKLAIFLLKCIRFILPKCFASALRRGIAGFSGAISNKKLLASFSGFHGYPKEISPEEWWAEGCDIKFEDKTVKAPKEYEKLLTHMFGNFMGLPPESQRINHNVDYGSIVFEGITKEDYKPTIIKERNPSKDSDYIIHPVN